MTCRHGTVTLAMAAAFASWGWIGSGSSALSANLPTVTIEARQELERRVDHFVTAEVFQAPGESIMRWNTPVCPSVVGLPRMFDDYIQGRILDVARAANAPAAGKHCRADLYVIATYDPKLFLQKLWAQVPHAHVSRNGLPGMERVLRSPRPVYVWFNSELHCRIDSMSGGKSADMSAVYFGGGGGAVDTTSPYFCGGGGSRLSYSSVNAIRSALVLVDMNRMTRVTTRELADYVAMVGLADLRPNAKAGTAPTILRLFGDPEQPPQGLSVWDQALLYSIYSTRQASVLQLSEIRAIVLARVEHQGSSGASTPPFPLWTAEIIPQRNTNIVGWYRAAAERGDAYAQFALGVIFANGQDVPRNYGTAAEWFRKAAEQGDGDAQFNLGILYADGGGVPRDYVKACKWWLVARADSGASGEASALSLAKLRASASQMTAEDMARAHRQASEWLKSHQQKLTIH